MFLSKAQKRDFHEKNLTTEFLASELLGFQKSNFGVRFWVKGHLKIQNLQMRC